MIANKKYEYDKYGFAIHGDKEGGAKLSDGEIVDQQAMANLVTSRGGLFGSCYLEGDNLVQRLTVLPASIEISDDTKNSDKVNVNLRPYHAIFYNAAEK